MRAHHRRALGSAAALVLLGGAGAFVALWRPNRATNAAHAATPTEEPRPPRDPVVAVGSRIHWNIPYVAEAHAQQTLDVYAPERAADAPVVVYVHRGEWARGDKSEVSYKPKLLNEQGIVLVSANYRLSDVAQHPAQAEDVAAAVRWVRDHIAEYGGAPDRIVLMGHSAGCHIASLVGLDARYLAGVGLERGDLRGVVCWSGGAYDLPAKVAEAGMYKEYIEKNFTTDAEAQRRASPIEYTGAPDPRTEFLFVSAGEGKAGSRMLSEQMVERIRVAGGRAQAQTLAGKTHFGADHDCGMPGDLLDSGAQLVRFVVESTRQRLD